MFFLIFPSANCLLKVFTLNDQFSSFLSSSFFHVEFLSYSWSEFDLVDFGEGGGPKLAITQLEVQN